MWHTDNFTTDYEKRRNIGPKCHLISKCLFRKTNHPKLAYKTTRSSDEGVRVADREAIMK